MRTIILGIPGQTLPCHGRSLRMLGVSLLLLLALPAWAVDRQTVSNQGAVAARQLNRIDRLPPANQLQIAIGLPLRNQPALTNLLRELYNPGSTNFHRF